MKDIEIPDVCLSYHPICFHWSPFPHRFQMGMLRLYSHCNAPYPGISRRNILRLQPIQNAAAGLLTRTKRSNHFASMRVVLHLLPERFRIDFRILLLVFKPWSVWLIAISVTPDGVRVKDLRQANSLLLYYFFHEFMQFIFFNLFFKSVHILIPVFYWLLTLTCI